MRIEVPGVLSTASQEIGIDFRKLEFPSCYRSDEVGHPALPAVRQLIATPAGCSISVSVSVPDSLTYSNSVVYPVPDVETRYTEEGYEYLEEEFAYDEEAYSMRGYYPTEIASVSRPGVLRGQGVALLTVYPIQFNAADDLIRVLPVLTVTLTFTGGSGGVYGDLGPFDSVAESVLLNYDGHGARGGRAQADTGKSKRCGSLAACDTLQTDYLMIVQDSLYYASTWIDSLAAHRAEWNGYNVAIVCDDVLGGQISDTAIKDFIEDVYGLGTAEHMSDGHLGYVLLVGDAREEEPYAYMPAHQVVADTITTDHWYACVDSVEQDDDYADLMLGRLCASDTQELETEVTKFILYERQASSGTSPTWRDTVLLSCGFAWRGWTDPPQSPWYCDLDDSTGHAVGTHQVFDVIRDIVQGEYEVLEVHAHEMEGANCKQQRGALRPVNIQLINEGCHIAQFGCHGWPLGMHTFDPNDVDDLHNSSRLPFWMSFSCATGAYDVFYDWSRDCLGEKLMHQEQDGSGAVAYLGASENSLGEKAAEYLGIPIWKALINSHHYELGQAIQYANLCYLSRTDDTRELLKYNLLGDPALNLQLTNHEGYSSAPDYVLADDSLLSTPMFPSYYGADTLTAVVHNVSNYDPDPGSPIAVVFSIQGIEGGATIFADTAYASPDAWGTDTVSVVWDQPGLTSIGELMLTVQVDTTGVELFKDNNTATKPFCIYFERPGYSPYNLGAIGGLSPTIADIDGIPGDEVLAAASEPGRLAALTGNGDELWPFPTPGGLPMRGPASAGDIDFDGDIEVVVCYGDSVMALDGTTGDQSWSDASRIRGLKSSASLGDLLGGDGRLEIVAEGTKPGHDQDSHTVIALSDSGAALWPQYAALVAAEPDVTATSPCLADLDGDGVTEILSSYNGFAGPTLVALNAQSGEQRWVETLGPSLGGVAPCSPVVAELVADSLGLEVVCGAKTLRCLSAGGDTLWGLPLPGVAAGCAIASVAGDANPEIIASVYSQANSLTPCRGWLFVVGHDGALIDSMSVDYRCQNQPVVADLDGDGDWEIIFSTACHDWEGKTWSYQSRLEILTYSSTGGLTRFLDPPRPLYFSGRLTCTPSIADTDENGRMEIWLVDGNGYVHCLEWPGSSGELSRWSSFQHDERHVGTYETPVSGQYPPGSAVSWWGDYRVTGDVLIDSTSSLVVQPGTTLRIASYCDDADLGIDPDLTELIIDGGTLQAQGWAANRIRLFPCEGCEGQPRSAKWRGIRLTAGSEAQLKGCTVRDAYKAIEAVDPDLVRAETCSLANYKVYGVYCIGDAGAADITLKRNTIGAGQIGVELHSCAATVDSNEIVGQAYGLKIYGDYGSTITSNDIAAPTDAYPFSGIYVNGSQDTLRLRDNELRNIKTYGITHWLRHYGRDEITGNQIAGDGVGTRGMYFYDSNALVRENTIENVSIPFWVDNYDGWTPDLGDISVSDGMNVTDPPEALQYYVRVVGTNHTIKAENNYWGADSLDVSKFYGPVDYNPYLASPPGRGDSDDSDSADQPVAFGLTQNRPNPFNPTTMFAFSVPRASRVRLCLFDLAGRCVKTLVDHTYETGRYTVEWDGRSDSGHNVASGVYFCRMEAGGFQASKKVILLK
ncbi:MAG: right-handed parallel beta-helix repeat-containing protein [Candidatus Eisenbacteria bacterium]|nr:right-handed parallel beta-helix repeat-containing protein [Candidatus Eisenbacteria bacterium]